MPESIQGTLADGSNYRVVKPAPWNGTIVLDLDFANNLIAPPSVIERWMTANGYAIGGISREPVAYRFRQAVDDLLEVRRLFIAKWGAHADAHADAGQLARRLRVAHRHGALP